MTEILVGVRLVAQGDGLVGQLQTIRAELGQFGAAGKSAAGGANEMAAATGRVEDAAGRAATAARTAGAAAGEMAAETGRVGDAADRVAPALDRSANAAREFSAGLKDTSNTSRVGRKALEDTNESLKAQAANAGMARAGWMGVGYQLQDVFASYGSGIKLSTIFAQQSGQLSSAISMIAAASGKTEGAVGRFATFMGGGWGIAVGVGISVLSTLVATLSSSEKGAKSAEDRAVDLTSAIDRQRASYRELMDAIDEYNRRQEKATETSRLATKESLAAARANYAEALSLREKIAAEIARQQSMAEQFRLSQGGTVGEDIGVHFANEAMAQNEAKIAALRQEITGRTLELGDAARKALDPLEAIRQKYVDIDRVLRRMTRDGKFNGVPVDRVVEELGRRQRAEEEAARKAQRQSNAGAASAATTAAFSSPLSGYRLTGRFGEDRRDHRHAGIDMAAAMGTPVYATQAGTVNFAGNAGSYGNLIKIGHGAGTETRYGHLSRIAVADGQAVAKGDLIGNVGSTGRSSGAHLHYEVRVNGKPVDPTKGAFPIDEAKVAENAQKAADDLKAFGDKSAASIKQISDQFAEQPRLVTRVNQATAELDGIIADLAARKPPGFEKMIADAKALQGLLPEALNGPYNEFMRAQRESAELDKLALAGRQDEADALRIVLRLQSEGSTLSAEQLANVLETVKAQRESVAVLAQQQETIGAYLDVTRSVRGEIEAIFAGQAKLSNFKSIARQLQSRLMTEQLFGPALRSLEDYVRQNAFGPAVEQLARDTGDAGDAVTDFAATVRQATDRIEGGSRSTVSADAPPGAPGSAGAAGVAAALLQAAKGGSADGATDEIVVEGRRAGKNTVTGLTPNVFFEEMMRRVTSPLLDGLDDLLGVRFFAGMKGVLSGAISGYLTAGPAGGILGALKEIPGLPDGISKALGKSLKGAETGTMTAGVMKSLGIKTSTTGAQIGGAIGAALPIPGGQIIGSILGGLVGGLFKKTKTGSASIGNLDGEGAITGTAGNSKSRITAASGLAGQALSALDQVIEQLNGELGQFSASIGVRKKKFVVDPTGQGRTKGSGTLKFDTEAEAQAALLADIFADGAVSGVSAAVAKALRSSTDVDAAVKEALKVQDVEMALGGIGAKFAAEFKSFDRQAGERLRIAQKYGFDVVELEKRNAADRLKLSEKLLADQVGGLQQLVKEMTGGSLFEGSAIEQRTAILGQIEQAKADLNAGVEGAADVLADLYGQLNTVSKAAFGTTGGFVNDRSAILSGAQAAIDRAKEQLAAAEKSDPALATTNAALDENNGQNAQMISSLAAIQAYLAQMTASGGYVDYSRLAALARTSA